MSLPANKLEGRECHSPRTERGAFVGRSHYFSTAHCVAIAQSTEARVLMIKSIIEPTAILHRFNATHQVVFSHRLTNSGRDGGYCFKIPAHVAFFALFISKGSFGTLPLSRNMTRASSWRRGRDPRNRRSHRSPVVYAPAKIPECRPWCAALGIGVPVACRESSRPARGPVLAEPLIVDVAGGIESDA
jgi:hypothetical protein